MTLAEVLITILVVGSVAAITIRILNNYTADLELKSALQKDVSVMSQATTQMASNNGGTLIGLFSYVFGNPTNNVNAFATHISYIKKCTSNVDTNGCWHSDGNWYKNSGAPVSLFGASFYSANGGFVLKDGTLLLISYRASSTCTGAWMGYEDSGTRTWGSGQPLDCEIVFVDVNGFKKPNRIGKDIFALSIREPGILYPGVYAEGGNPGTGCAYKVLMGEPCP